MFAVCVPYVHRISIAGGICARLGNALCIYSVNKLLKFFDSLWGGGGVRGLQPVTSGQILTFSSYTKS